ncbi:hypothetical protein KSD_42090 [Ktedonobacter sp. SOSP1-85]|uniref:hypothetical protein n=1 Tax=Ktedonobacter sp. SOSP1-85 TaxID=2778367 RepID=UPI001915BC96|nr:hypothetical protein [Ktedonobacter sp. SOSP1-85]GHO76438.1 hypothetical protein KSD_42090 [Ktedonobacter sp. SOSP1-85]
MHLFHAPRTPIDQEHTEALILEQHAERQALSAVRGANFTQCLSLHHLTADLELVDPRGRPHLMHGKDLFDERTWNKFLASLQHSINVLSLTQSAEPLTKLYRTWLLTKYTQRYRWLSTPAQIQWFEQVTALVILRKVMEAKHHAWTYQQNEQAFADSWCAMEMKNLMTLNTMTTEIAKAIHHIVRQPEQAKEMIEHLFEIQATRLFDHPVSLRHPLPSLPPLPEGAALPQAILPLIAPHAEQAEEASQRVTKGKEE